MQAGKTWCPDSKLRVDSPVNRIQSNTARIASNEQKAHQAFCIQILCLVNKLFNIGRHCKHDRPCLRRACQAIREDKFNKPRAGCTWRRLTQMVMSHQRLWEIETPALSAGICWGRHCSKVWVKDAQAKIERSLAAMLRFGLGFPWTGRQASTWGSTSYWVVVS